MTKKFEQICIFGALSEIAIETARVLATRQHARFFLVARNRNRLSELAQDLKTRGALDVVTEICDLDDTEQHQALLNKINENFSNVDLYFFAWGVLGDENLTQINYQEAHKVIHTNFLAPVSLLTEISSRLVHNKQKSTIAVITSVAGDRGRQSRYVYGSAKSGLTTYLQGLRNRLYPHDISVVTIKPGIIRTPMTANMKTGRLTAEAKPTAQGIYAHLVSGCEVFYVPKIWFWIMLIIKSIPENLFKRLRL